MAARSSVTCLNGTQRGARTEPLRLIGHSNVTRSLPKRLGGDTWPSEGAERRLVEKGNGAEGLAPPAAKFFLSLWVYTVRTADCVSDSAFGLSLCQR